MATVTFDTTISGQYANSYVDLNYATDYFENHFDSTKAAGWDALSPIQQQRLLIMGCSIIETARFTNYIRPSDYAFFYDYITGMVRQLAERMEPVRFMNTQALQFPRNIDIDTTTGLTFVPDRILEAQCEQAYYMLSYDGQAVANRLQGVISDTISIGRSQIHAAQVYLSEGSAFSPLALELCRPFFLKGGQRMRRA